MTVQKCRDFLASPCNMLGDLSAKGVHGTGVAVEIAEVREHDIPNLRSDACGRIVIKVDYPIHLIGYYTTIRGCGCREVGAWEKGWEPP